MAIKYISNSYNLEDTPMYNYVVLAASFLLLFTKVLHPDFWTLAGRVGGKA